MHMKFEKTVFALFCVIFFWVGGAVAANKSLSLVDSSGAAVFSVTEGDAISVEVRVDDASFVAGAAFTVTYDTANLALRTQNPVTSSFFDTFVNQGLLTPPTDPEFITVDNTDYYSPIADNPINTGVMIAAARVDNGTGTDVALFTLHFELIGSPGTYPINITASTISNEAAGYAPGGEEIPLLVGIDGTSYPVHTVSTEGASLTVVPAFVDTDNDGIDDNWERANVPAGTPVEGELDVFTATGDYDHDGYTDYQEYLNQGELDPGGNVYDPTVRNVAGGTGYRPKVNPAINFLLLGS